MVENSKTNTLRPQFLPALSWQAIILLLASMVLDGGGIFQVCFYALVGYWGGVAVLLLRKRASLSITDTLFIRHGYIFVCVISFLVTRLIWHLRGYGKYL